YVSQVAASDDRIGSIGHCHAQIGGGADRGGSSSCAVGRCWIELVGNGIGSHLDGAGSGGRDVNGGASPSSICQGAKGANHGVAGGSQGSLGNAGIEQNNTSGQQVSQNNAGGCA